MLSQSPALGTCFGSRGLQCRYQYMRKVPCTSQRSYDSMVRPKTLVDFMSILQQCLGPGGSATGSACPFGSVGTRASYICLEVVFRTPTLPSIEGYAPYLPSNIYCAKSIHLSDFLPTCLPIYVLALVGSFFLLGISCCLSIYLPLSLSRFARACYNELGRRYLGCLTGELQPLCPRPNEGLVCQEF